MAVQFSNEIDPEFYIDKNRDRRANRRLQRVRHKKIRNEREEW